MSRTSVLITGASSGIGQALAIEYGKLGWHVALVARRQAALEATAASVSQAGGTPHIATCDVGDTAQIVKTVRSLDEQLSGLDMIIANAGIGALGSGRKLTFEAIEEVLRVNFNGAIATLTAVLPAMLQRKRGHLVGISSLSALAPLPRAAPYGASKAGLTYFLESLRQDLTGTGVAVTAVHPGFIRTPMLGDAADKRPFLWEANTASQHIVSRLIAQPAVIDFPLPTRLAVGLAANLPRAIREPLARRLVR